MQTADRILGTDVGQAGSLFPGDVAQVRKAFRAMAKEWHPDLNADPRASAVFSHLKKLSDAAIRAAAGATARVATGAKETFVRADGSKLAVRYARRHPTGFGEAFIGAHSLTYRFDAEWRDVAEAEEARCLGFPYADKAMEAAVSRYLASLERRIDLAGGGVLLVFRRPADTVLMTDMIGHLGRVPAVHVAWIVSSMMNLACYLQWAGLVHGAIAPENVLVRPERHSLVLVGGWGFSVKSGERPVALPRRTLEMAPCMGVKGQVADHALDLDLVRATGRELLGHSAGGGIRMDREVPGPMADWLLAASDGDAVSEYGEWTRVLEASFGPRKFVPMGMVPTDVYS